MMAGAKYAKTQVPTTASAPNHGLSAHPICQEVGVEHTTQRSGSDSAPGACESKRIEYFLRLLSLPRHCESAWRPADRDGLQQQQYQQWTQILLRQRRVVSLYSLVEQILYLRRAALQQVESSHFPWSSLARPQERNAATTQQCSGDTQQVAGDQRQGHACGDDRRQGDHPGCGKDRSR